MLNSTTVLRVGAGAPGTGGAAMGQSETAMRRMGPKFTSTMGKLLSSLETWKFLLGLPYSKLRSAFLLFNLGIIDFPFEMGITKSPTGQVCLPLCENLTHEALEPPLLPVRYFPPFHHPVYDLVSCLFSGQVSISFSKSQGWKAVVLTNPLEGSLPFPQVQHCALCLTPDWHFLHTVDSEGHFSSQAGLLHICGQATAWVLMRLLHLNQSWL